jgi:hypothetical protein
MVTDLAEQFALRLIAECLMCNGRVDQALQCLAKSFPDDRSLHVISPRIIPDLEYAPIDESYMTIWFHGLGHEIGHHLGERIKAVLVQQDFLTSDAIRELVDTITQRFVPHDKNRDVLEYLADSLKVHSALEVIQVEAVADIFSSFLLIGATAEVFSVMGRRPVELERLFQETMLAFASLTTIQECKMMADWFADIRAMQEQTIVFSNIALQARNNLFLRACGSESLRTVFPSFFDLYEIPNAEEILGCLEQRSWHVAVGVQRARSFLSSPAMRDPELFYNFLPRAGGHLAPELRQFVRRAQILKRTSPELTELARAIGYDEPYPQTNP